MSDLDHASTPRLGSPLLRPHEAAALLSVKTSWIYDAVRAGRLPCLSVGRHIRFTRAMLEDWLATRGLLASRHLAFGRRRRKGVGGARYG